MSDTTETNTAASPRSSNTWFSTTQWTVVLNAQDEQAGNEALSQLCQTYWFPLFTYVRRKGHQPADAEDLTQGFLTALIEKRWIDRANRNRGRFRTFLLTCFDRYLCGEFDKTTALKRGGHREIVSVDWNEAETKLNYAMRAERTPEEAYDLAWATEILRRALQRLQESYEESGKSDIYQVLSPMLVGEAEYGQLAEAASTLGMEAGAVRVASTRMRQKYRELLFAEVAQTVVGEEEAQAEYRQISEILRRG